MRKKLRLILPLLLLWTVSNAAYHDHRGHNVDSLETVMARWTAEEIASAGDSELKQIASDLCELMNGYLQTNGVKSEYYARMLLQLSRRKGWLLSEQESSKIIGQHFWARERYDSAAFYYSIAMDATRRIPEDDSEKDNALSQMYGTLGNLYSMMDSISIAMDYYRRAGELFKKHDWFNSCSVLYYNMGETMRVENELREAESYYKESLRYAVLAGDSLEVATANKDLGSLYMEMGKTARAMRYLEKSNEYFANHEKEELQYRMESLDYTGQVLALQKKRLVLIIILFAVLAALSVATLYVARRLRQTKVENKELTEVLEDSVETISVSSRKSDVTLKPREREVLDLIAKGYTNVQIADAMCLSSETIKWYKKKLFAMFDAANSAELVTIAKDNGLI